MLPMRQYVDLYNKNNANKITSSVLITYLNICINYSINRAYSEWLFRTIKVLIQDLSCIKNSIGIIVYLSNEKTVTVIKS